MKGCLSSKSLAVRARQRFLALHSAPNWRLPEGPDESNIAFMKNDKGRDLSAQTRAIHSGEPERHGVDAPVNPGIVRSSTFTFASSREIQRWAEGKSKAYIYSRYGNPTLTVAQKKIAALEGAEAAIVTSAGMAAISHSLLSKLSSECEIAAIPAEVTIAASAPSSAAIFFSTTVSVGFPYRE